MFFFSSRRRHTRFSRDWSSDVCSSDYILPRLRPVLMPLTLCLDADNILRRAPSRPRFALPCLRGRGGSLHGVPGGSVAPCSLLHLLHVFLPQSVLNQEGDFGVGPELYNLPVLDDGLEVLDVDRADPPHRLL